MLRLKEFELVVPETLSEVLSFLNRNKKTLLIAGGTDIIPKMKRRQIEPDFLVSLLGVKEINFIKVEKNVIRIGSGVSLKKLEEMKEIEKLKVLHQSIKKVATPIIRNQATIGGNLLQDTRCKYFDRSLFWRSALGFCLKRGGTECKIAPGAKRCYATFCSDLAPSLIVLDAKVKIKGEEEKTLPLENLYRDEGIYNLNLKKKEILTEIIIPKNSYDSTYKKLRIRDGIDFPEAAVAVAYKNNGNEIKINISVSGMSSGIYFLKEKFSFVSGVKLREKLHKIVEKVYNSLKPVDNLYFPPLYRKKIVRHFLLKSFDELL